PADLTEHLGIGIYDNTAYQLALDALTHHGPADRSRVAAITCLRPLMPGIDPSTFAANYAQTVASVAATVASSPRATSEPPPACYVTATCPTGRAAAQQRSSRARGRRSAASRVTRPAARHRRRTRKRGRHHHVHVSPTAYPAGDR
ncbi:MAG: hypothetical protein ACRDPM_09795, partial [Solirubrobacteraceae bacterium]